MDTVENEIKWKGLEWNSFLKVFFTRTSHLFKCHSSLPSWTIPKPEKYIRFFSPDLPSHKSSWSNPPNSCQKWPLFSSTLDISLSLGPPQLNFLLLDKIHISTLHSYKWPSHSVPKWSFQMAYIHLKISLSYISILTDPTVFRIKF